MYLTSFSDLYKASVGVLALVLASMAISSDALGQGISIENVTTGGSTAETDLGYVAQNDIAQFTVDIDFDGAALTPEVDNPGNVAPTVTGCIDSPGANWEDLTVSCRLVASDRIRIVVATGFTGDIPLDSADPFGSISWSVNSGEPGDEFIVDGEVVGVFVDGEKVPNSTLDLSDGSITVEAPAGAGFYASTPAPGGNVDLGEAVVNTPATALEALNVQNPSPDTDFDITGFNGPAILGFPATPITVGFGTDQDVPIDCTPTARGDNGGNFTVMHDAASGATSPVDYTFACVGLAPNVNVPIGPVEISGLTVDTNPLTADFEVTNPDDGFTSDAMNVTAAAAGDAAISVAPNGPLTIARDGMQTFTVSCDNSADGDFTSTITIEWNDPVSGGTASDTIDATCDVSNAVASFDSEPAAPGPLAFGTVTNGTTSAPLGVDVFNDGVGPSPDSDLTITSVATDDAQFDATLVNAGPFEVGDPADGTDDIEVTCTPDAGAGALTGTLTVEHDGDDSPTLFDLTCQGESDGTFSSNPAAGGTINLGVVPPNNTTPEGFIDFTNNGSVDDITVDCTVTDDDGAFTFDPDPIDFTLEPGATESAGFQCTPPDPTSFSAAVSCNINGDPDVSTAEYTVSCQGQVLAVPTMNRWGLLLMALLVLGLGGFAGRRMMA